MKQAKIRTDRKTERKSAYKKTTILQNKKTSFGVIAAKVKAININKAINGHCFLKDKQVHGEASLLKRQESTFSILKMGSQF